MPWGLLAIGAAIYAVGKGVKDTGEGVNAAGSGTMKIALAAGAGWLLAKKAGLLK